MAAVDLLRRKEPRLSLMDFKGPWDLGRDSGGQWGACSSSQQGSCELFVSTGREPLLSESQFCSWS